MSNSTPRMVYRRFGKTELQMPVLTCGGMRYQHSWQDAPADEIPAESHDRVESCIHRALELGINHIETARGYGSSERELGRILPSLPRDEILVQTKISPGKNARVFRSTLETSLQRLQLDYVDLLSIHGINNDELIELTFKKNGALAALQRAKDDGLARHIGFSSHAPTPLILRIIETGVFEYVNLHWYYFDQINAPAIDLAHQHDMGVFIISPSDKGGQLYKPPKKLIDLTAPLTPMAFNDLFCLSRPDVHTISIGAAHPSDFNAHLEAVRQLADVAAVLGPICNRMEDELVRVHGRRWAENWMTSLPLPAEVPGNVPIYQVLRLFNLATAYDMTEFSRWRYNMLGEGGHWFAGRKLGELDWTKLDDCIRESPVADLIPEKLREAHSLLDGKSAQRLSQTD